MKKFTEQEVLTYLEEVFGLDSVDALSRNALILECIQENADDGFPLDIHLIEMVNKKT